VFTDIFAMRKILPRKITLSNIDEYKSIMFFLLSNNAHPVFVSRNSGLCSETSPECANKCHSILVLHSGEVFERSPVKRRLQ